MIVKTKKQKQRDNEIFLAATAGSSKLYYNPETQEFYTDQNDPIAVRGGLPGWKQRVETLHQTVKLTSEAVKHGLDAYLKGGK